VDISLEEKEFSPDAKAGEKDEMMEENYLVNKLDTKNKVFFLSDKLPSIPMRSYFIGSRHSC
jgi:hypothetical protein